MPASNKKSEKSKKSSKSISSSRVSSKTTTRIADNQGVKPPKKSVFKNNMVDVANQAVIAVPNFNVFGALIAAVQNYDDLKSGVISGKKYIDKVGKAGVKSIFPIKLF
jgi:hypothetical protein